MVPYRSDSVKVYRIDIPFFHLHTRFMVTTPREIREVLVLLALVTGGMGIPTGGTALAGLLSGLILRNIIIIVVILYILDIRHRRHVVLPGKGHGERRPLSRLSAAGIAAAAALVLIVLAIAIEAVAGFAHGRANHGSHMILQQLTGDPRLPLVLLTVAAMVIIGYGEELFFRAYLLQQLQILGAPRKVAVCGAAAVFAVGHFSQGGTAVFQALGGAVLLSAIWLRWRNLHLTAWAHILYNGTALFLVWLMHYR